MSLTADELASMQATATGSLPDTANVQRPTSTPDSTGGQTMTWATVLTGVACRVSPLGGDEAELAERVASSASWVVTFVASTDVRAADRIVYGSRTLEVTSVQGARSWEVSRRVFAREVL